MLYTLDYINNHEDGIPDIHLGALILDDCDKASYGLTQAVDFIKGQLAQDGATHGLDTLRSLSCAARPVAG